MKLYIREQNNDLNELAYYGPFEKFEIEERLNDAMSDRLAGSLANVDAVLLSLAETSAMYINPREFWMNELEQIMKDRAVDA